MIPSMRREYYEALAARHYRIQENISCMYADAHKEAMTPTPIAPDDNAKAREGKM